MKIIVNSYELANAVSKVSKACAVKTLNELLEGMKLKAENDTLTLSAYDGEMSIETTIKCETFIDGEALINGKLLSEYTSKIATDGEVSIATQENGRVSFKCGGLKCTLSGMDVKMYPNIVMADSENAFEIATADFKTLINRVKFCAATEASRPILRGVLLEVVKEGELTACAVDGFRLAKAVMPIKNAVVGLKCVAPANSLSHLIQLIGADEQSISVNISRNQLAVITGNVTFTTKLYVGEFVNYNQLLSGLYETNARARTEDLVSVIDRASVLAKSTANNLIKMDLYGGVLNVSANTDIGEMNESLEVGQDGNDLTIHLNYKYLLDCLKIVPTEEVILQFKDKQSPMFIRNVDEASEWEYLILPVRVSR